MIDFEKVLWQSVVGGAKGLSSAVLPEPCLATSSLRSLQPSVLPSAVLSELYSDFSLISPFKFVG